MSLPSAILFKMALYGNGIRTEASGTNTIATRLIRIVPGSSCVSVSNVIINGRLAAACCIQAPGVTAHDLRSSTSSIAIEGTVQGLLDIFSQP